MTESLTLSAALKLAGMTETGGQAKSLIQQGCVRVNGEIERRRKRRVVAGDEIEIGGEVFVIELLDTVPADGPDATHIDTDDDRYDG